jgi:branched-chain amino acid aminotransferase
MEFLESQIQDTLKANDLSNASARIKLIVHRNEGGLYLPQTNDVSYIISTRKIDEDFYILNEDSYEVDLFKDYYITPGLLSTLKTNNKVLHVVGSMYAKENNLNNCLLLNTNKHVIEALNGNIFIVKDTFIKTPPITDGCLKGIMRKQILELLPSLEGYTFEETSISPFELQKADELFLTNVITGIQSITKYRKKTYTSDVAKKLLQKLNIKIRLSSTN